MAGASAAEPARRGLRSHAASGGVASLVAQQALRTPNSCALAAGPGSAIAYGVLWAAAWRAASGLVRGGLRAGGHAAVFVDEGAGLVATELAVWVAGGVVVPLDAAWPCERLLFLLADAAAEVAVCGRAQRNRLAGLGVPLLCHEDLQASEPVLDPVQRPPAREDACCHLIYTSGSTGQPKAVACSHAALRAYLRAKPPVHGVTAGAVVLLVSAHTWDPSLGDAFSSLAVGATLALAPRGKLVEALADTVRQSAASHACATPAAWSLLGRGCAGTLPSLRTVALGGERMPGDLSDAWSGRVRLLNVYGVTEATVYQTWHHCVPSQPMLAGVPMQRVLVRVDEDQEVLLAGPQLADGYWGRPELTAQRFVEDAELGRRVFRTGDLGRWEGGALAVLGRRDNQVKVRGLRVELEEVEAVLHSSGLSLHAAVAKVGDALVAACALAGSAAEGTAVMRHGGEILLRTHCRDKMPAHQIPARFVTLDALPLTVSGKLDRRAVAASLEQSAAAVPELAPQQAEGPGVAAGPSLGAHLAGPPAETASERAVAAAWQEALGLDRAPHLGETFWDLGGTSAGALAMLAALERRLGGRFSSGEAAHVRLCALLRKPRLQDYARFVEWIQARPPTAGGPAGSQGVAPEGAGDALLAEAEAELGAGEGEDRTGRLGAGLLAAAGRGLREVCAALLRLGAPPDGLRASRGDGRREAAWGRPPLLAAASGGHVQVCELLLDARASVVAFDRDQRGPLHAAVLAGSAPTVRLLASARAAVEAKDGQRWTPLHLAVWSDGESRLELASCLLWCRSDSNARDRWRRTPLSYAVTLNDLGVVGALLAAMAEPGCRLPKRASRVGRGGEESWEPNPMLALRAGAEDGWAVLRLLLEAACSANLADDAGRTAVHAAAAAGGAGTRDGLASCAAGAASPRGALPALRMLLQARGSANARDGNGCTPLHEAARAGDEATARLLLGASADPAAANARGERPGDVLPAAPPPDLAALVATAGSARPRRAQPPAAGRPRGDAGAAARAARPVIAKGRFGVLCSNEPCGRRTAAAAAGGRPLAQEELGAAIALRLLLSPRAAAASWWGALTAEHAPR